jgi:DNA-binding protein HU-beta
MTKADVITKLAEVTGTKKAAEEVFNMVFECITKSLKKEGSFGVVGFGTLKVAKRAARKGRNPKTGEAIKIKASKTVRFVPSKNLKGLL